MAFDDLAKLASTICGTPSAVISLIDHDRQWFKARVGCGRTSTERSLAVCDHAIRTPRSVMEVRDLRLDPRFTNNPMLRSDGIVFYAGAPMMFTTLSLVNDSFAVKLDPPFVESAKMRQPHK